MCLCGFKNQKRNKKMTRILIVLFLTSFYFSSFAQNLTATQVLEKSIKYHDPKGKWPNVDIVLKLKQDSPKRGASTTIVEFNAGQSQFHSSKKTDDGLVERNVNLDVVSSTIDGKTDFSEELAKKHRLSDERTKMYRNYYVYLYGLPMKLKDPGTNIQEEILDTTFQETPCWGIKVTYDKAVGNDIWYFYFDKNNYALIGYRFYHDESKNDGEYIVLKEEAVVNGIRIPKIRSWYTHKADQFLGTDTVE